MGNYALNRIEISDKGEVAGTPTWLLTQGILNTGAWQVSLKTWRNSTENFYPGLTVMEKKKETETHCRLPVCTKSTREQTSWRHSPKVGSKLLVTKLTLTGSWCKSLYCSWILQSDSIKITRGALKMRPPEFTGDGKHTRDFQVATETTTVYLGGRI